MSFKLFYKWWDSKSFLFLRTKFWLFIVLSKCYSMTILWWVKLLFFEASNVFFKVGWLVKWEMDSGSQKGRIVPGKVAHFFWIQNYKCQSPFDCYDFWLHLAVMMHETLNCNKMKGDCSFLGHLKLIVEHDKAVGWEAARGLGMAGVGEKEAVFTCWDQEGQQELCLLFFCNRNQCKNYIKEYELSWRII